jgi:AraC-like DNA-binding protein
MAWTFTASCPVPGADPATWRAWAAVVVAGAAADLAAGRGTILVPAPAGAAGGGHFHHMPECFIQLSGRRRFRFPSAEAVLDPGGILVVPPLLAHGEQQLGAGPSGNLVCSVQTGWLSVHAGLLVAGSLQPVGAEAIPVADHALGDGCLRRACAGSDPGERRLWLRAFLAWAGAAIAAAPLPAPGRHVRVGRALALIHYHLAEPAFGVAALARALGCTAGHLTRQFREDLGETPVACIQRIRLDRARDLLRDPAMAVRAAARLTGFRDPAYFSRAYRARFGAPPSQRAAADGMQSPGGSSG